MNMLVLDWRRRLYLYKKSCFFIPRAAALVLTTSLGPESSYVLIRTFTWPMPILRDLMREHIREDEYART